MRLNPKLIDKPKEEHRDWHMPDIHIAWWVWPLLGTIAYVIFLEWLLDAVINGFRVGGWLQINAVFVALAGWIPLFVWWMAAYNNRRSRW